MTVRDAMSREVLTVGPGHTLRQVSVAMHSRKVGAAVVVDPDGEGVGIITERDIIRAVADKGTSGLTYKVEDFMTREVRTCKTSASIKDVMELMSLRRVRHVPVLENGELLGMVSSTDVVKYRLEERSVEVAGLRDVTRSR